VGDTDRLRRGGFFGGLGFIGRYSDASVVAERGRDDNGLGGPPATTPYMLPIDDEGDVVSSLLENFEIILLVCDKKYN
jgi:hypothetical protein